MDEEEEEEEEEEEPIEGGGGGDEEEEEEEVEEKEAGMDDWVCNLSGFRRWYVTSRCGNSQSRLQIEFHATQSC